MKDLSLYILDIAMNSVRAEATKIEIFLDEIDNVLTLQINDNGCGMTEETVKSLSNPFYTTRKTRKVGLGVPFLTMLAEQTGGSVKITSRPKSDYENHGTEVKATFRINHIDFVPIGDTVETLITLIQGSPDIDFVYRHTSSEISVMLDTREMREILGDVPLNSYEVLSFVREYLLGQYNNDNN